jgi:hypothetical protein
MRRGTLVSVSVLVLEDSLFAADTDGDGEVAGSDSDGCTSVGVISISSVMAASGSTDESDSDIVLYTGWYLLIRRVFVSIFCLMRLQDCGVISN